MRQAGRGHLSPDKIEAVLDCARHTVGLPCLAAEQDDLKALAAELRHNRQQREAVAAQLAQQIDRDPPLKPLSDVLGKVTTALLVAERLDPRDYAHSRSYCKAVGLNLKERSSGQHQGELKLSKRGSAQARRDLYLATLRLIQRDATVRAWYDRKVQAQGGRGKPKVVVALMRKRTRALWPVARGQAFDAQKLCGAN